MQPMSPISLSKGEPSKVVTACDFARTYGYEIQQEISGMAMKGTGFIPAQSSYLQALELGNLECSRLGIAPAISLAALEWLKTNSYARLIRPASESFEVIPVFPGSQNKNREEMIEFLNQQEKHGWQNLHLPEIEEVIFDNALVHIATLGEGDSFRGRKVRTAALDVVVGRTPKGVEIYSVLDSDRGSEIVAAASTLHYMTSMPAPYSFLEKSA